MTDINFQEAQKLFARPEIETYRSEQDAIRSTLERLRAERRAREATNP